MQAPHLFGPHDHTQMHKNTPWILFWNAWTLRNSLTNKVSYMNVCLPESLLLEARLHDGLGVLKEPLSLFYSWTHTKGSHQFYDWWGIKKINTKKGSGERFRPDVLIKSFMASGMIYGSYYSVVVFVIVDKSSATCINANTNLMIRSQN